MFFIVMNGFAGVPLFFSAFGNFIIFKFNQANFILTIYYLSVHFYLFSLVA